MRAGRRRATGAPLNGRARSAAPRRLTIMRARDDVARHCEPKRTDAVRPASIETPRPTRPCVTTVDGGSPGSRVFALRRLPGCPAASWRAARRLQLRGRPRPWRKRPHRSSFSSPKGSHPFDRGAEKYCGQCASRFRRRPTTRTAPAVAPKPRAGPHRRRARSIADLEHLDPLDAPGRAHLDLVAFLGLEQSLGDGGEPAHLAKL